MALSRQQKEDTVGVLSDLISNSKILVFANYDGFTVAQSQALRAKAQEAGATIRVAKNRLVKLVLSQVDGYKDADTSMLGGQLIYAFSAEDEVAPAQLFANFAKEHPTLNLVGAIDASGKVFTEEEVKTLASLPSKEQLRAQLVGTIAAPLSGFVNVMSGNVRGLVNVLNARVDNLNN